jgi:uncharacterized membrane protein
MRKIFGVLTLIALVIVLQNCHTSKKASTSTASATTSFERDILPVINNHCTPCHASPNGKVVHLDKYEGASHEINHMIKLVKLPADDPNFMPFKHKKPALTAEQIAMLEKWRDEGMPK